MREMEEDDETTTNGLARDRLLIDSPDRELVFVSDTSASIRRRTIYLFEEIDNGSYQRFAQALELMNLYDGPIRLFLNTPGGDVEMMFSMYDLIISSKNPIYTVGTGSVCSAGVLLLACGHKRFVTEHCSVMSHQSSVELEGRFDEVESRFRWTKWTENTWSELMARHTPLDAAHWKKLTKKEAESWYLGGNEVVARGLADFVIKGQLDEFINKHGVG